MKVSTVLLLAGLCLRAVAEEACTTEGSAARSARVLLQRAPGDGGSPKPIEEVDEADEAKSDSEPVEEADEANFDSEPVEEDDEAELDSEDEDEAEFDSQDEDQQGDKPPKPLKPCDKMKKKTVQKVVNKTMTTIGKITAGIQKCQAGKEKWMLFMKKALEHFQKCLGKYGAFVEDSVSEGAEGGEDGVDEQEELDEQEEINEREDFDEQEEVDEMLEPSEPVEASELVSAEVGKPNATKKVFPPCDKVPDKKAELAVGKIKDRMKKLSKAIDACKTKTADKLAYLGKKLAHFQKCI